MSAPEAQIVFGEAMVDVGFYTLTVLEQLESDLKKISKPEADLLIEATRKAIISQKQLIKSFKETIETAIKLQQNGYE